MATLSNPKLQAILARDEELKKKYFEFLHVFEEKFGSHSQMYRDGVETVNRRIISGSYEPGIPSAYQKYWQPYEANEVLHHITTSENIDSIKINGLDPRDPFPRPWSGMKAVYMGDPNDPSYAESKNSVIDYVREKGSRPVVLTIKTKNSLYKSIEPRRTFQVMSLSPIPPEDIIEYAEI